MNPVTMTDDETASVLRSPGRGPGFDVSALRQLCVSPRTAAGRPPKVNPERVKGLFNWIKTMVCGIITPCGKKTVSSDSHYSMYSWMMVKQPCGGDPDLTNLQTPTAATSRLHVAAGLRPCLKLALVDLRKFDSAGTVPA